MKCINNLMCTVNSPLKFGWHFPQVSSMSGPCSRVCRPLICGFEVPLDFIYINTFYLCAFVLGEHIIRCSHPTLTCQLGAHREGFKGTNNPQRIGSPQLDPPHTHLYLQTSSSSVHYHTPKQSISHANRSLAIPRTLTQVKN